jgi:hypothetical protein
VVGVPTTRARSGPLLHPFQASANTFNKTTEGRHSVTTQHTVRGKVTQLCSAPSTSRRALPNVTIQGVEEGSKGGKWRCKQHRLETVTMTDNDGHISKQAGSSGVEHTTAVTGSSKRQAQLPMDHFEKLREGT